MLKRIAILSLSVFLSACSPSDPVVDISTYDKVNPLFGIPYVEVEVTAVDDEVEIEDIIVNRGNCKLEKLAEAMNRGKTVPRTLAYGETARFSFGGPCAASEVEVITDMGSWTWNY